MSASKTKISVVISGLSHTRFLSHMCHMVMFLFLFSFLPEEQHDPVLLHLVVHLPHRAQGLLRLYHIVLDLRLLGRVAEQGMCAVSDVKHPLTPFVDDLDEPKPEQAAMPDVFVEGEMECVGGLAEEINRRGRGVGLWMISRGIRNSRCIEFWHRIVKRMRRKGRRIWDGENQSEREGKCVGIRKKEGATRICTKRWWQTKLTLNGGH